MREKRCSSPPFHPGRTPPVQDNQNLPEESERAEDRKKGCPERSRVLNKEPKQVSTGGQNWIGENLLGIGSDILDLRQTEPPGVLSHTESGVGVTHGPVNMSISDPSACRSMDSPLTGSSRDENISLRRGEVFLNRKTVLVMTSTI